MNKIVEKSRKILEADLKNTPYVLDDPLGNSVTSRKIQDYMFLCVTNSVSKPDCVDWLYELYKEQNDEQHNKFQSHIDLSANMLYDFYVYLNKC